MFFRIGGVVVIAVFYGVYFLKMFSQHRAGIRTDQLGAGKKGREKTIEICLKASTLAAAASEIISLIMDTALFSLPVRAAGFILASAGTVLFIAAVTAMGDSWRAGVSTGSHTDLVTGGIFRISRNPAFLGFDLVYVGFFLMFGNLPLGVISAVCVLMFHLQIIYVEEKFLPVNFGEDYRKYSEKVCRYLGCRGVGKSDMAAVFLLAVCGISGLLSLPRSAQDSLEVVNQYGRSVTLWGYGVYARDSVLKAAGYIGSDLIVLTVQVPLFISVLVKNFKDSSRINKLKLSALYSASLYYAASMSFGAAYNRLMLIYIALFGLSFFRYLLLACEIKIPAVRAGKGLKAFLIVLGIALCAAWLPDILTSLTRGEPLSSIEVYTTEVTYVIDIGIMCPMCFLSLSLIRRQNPLGAVFASSMLMICFMAGLMVISQSVFQHLAGIEIPAAQLASKVLIFATLSVFSLVLQRNWYARVRQS